MTSTPPSSHAQAHGRFRHLGESECLDLLTTTTVGRVAFVDDDDRLQLLPLNFGLIDDRIYFRTAPDSVLASLATPRRVAFGVDHHADVFREGWNVTVRGTTRQVVEPAVIQCVTSWSRLHPWAKGTRDLVIALDRESAEGRWVHGA